MLRTKSLLPFALLSLVVVGCSEDDTEAENGVAYHQNGDAETLFENDPNGVNVIFLGDGFVRKDLRVGGYYEQAGRDIIDHLFTVPPFSTYRQYFNAYIVYAASTDEFISEKGAQRNTAFGVTWDGKLDRGLSVDPSVCYNYARNAVGYDQDKTHVVILLANDHRYGGRAFERVALTTRQYKEETVVHEIGHTLGGLADEYEDSTFTLLYDASWFLKYSANVDVQNNLEKIKWAHFVGRDNYEAVGAFEGGNYVRLGVWRPEENSLMRDLSVSYFNAPSREAIVKKIFEIKGLPYRWEDFLANDVIPTPFNARTHKADKKPLFNCRQR